jgi:hypothetical protein
VIALQPPALPTVELVVNAGTAFFKELVACRNFT